MREELPSNPLELIQSHPQPQIHRLTEHELQDPEHLLKDVLFPQDAYTPDGTYWADLPFWPRVHWINAQNSAETKRELAALWTIFKNDPLDPIRIYFKKYVMTGMGLFVEGYTLFSVGNIKPLFQVVWPACWSTFAVCDRTWTHAVEYLEIVGIIVGQVYVGIIGDWIGRRMGMIQDAAIMTLGCVLLTGMWGTSLNGWVIMYALSLMFYSVGVGGEYPMTGISAMETSSLRSSSDDKLHRGRNVSLAFLMQGWGQLANQAILIVGMLAFHGGASEPYSKLATQWTFRVSFAAVGLVTAYLLYHRIYHLKFADQALRISKKKQKVTGYDVQSLKLVSTHYWHRLVGTAGGWFANDFFFYGNKIFQGVFLRIITPDASVMDLWLWNLVNIGCSLAGYYLAALLIDHKLYGRKHMQSIGFLVQFILFIIPAAMYDTLRTPGTPIKIFQFLYFFSSFWQQFGPNSTTFLLAAEVYPAPVRASAHGFSAACGKLGALIPTIIYNYVPNHTKFWIVTWFGLLGLVCTVLFIPDTTGLDLVEQERYWGYVREGREGEYHGIAIHPRHLSWWERVVLRRDKGYDPMKDREAKIRELRAVYEASVVEEKEEGLGLGSVEGSLDGEGMDEKVSRYFARERERGGAGSSASSGSLTA
ncbi:hypothetical protein YB2330_003366 [Saitoella coloradoensis]